MLIESIKINTGTLDKGKIMLSNGTYRTSRINAKEVKSPVFVPGNIWRHPTFEECEMLINSGSFHYEQVSILKLNKTRVNKLKKIFFSTHKIDEGNINELLVSVEWELIKNELTSFASNYILKKATLVEGGLALKKGNLTSTTINPINQEFTGLHLDSWEKISYLKERQSSRNRLCFNLGSHPRYFCFLNLSLDKIFQQCYQDSFVNKYQEILANDYGFVYFFLEYNPSYPIVRVRLDPFEAYIAPTESVLHDGSSAGNTSWDVSYTVRSYFQVF